MNRILVALCLPLLFVGCKSGPEIKAVAAEPPRLAAQELTIAEQGLTDCRVRLDGQVYSQAAARIVKATWELVVEEKVVQSGEEPLGIDIPAGATVPFSLSQTSRYVTTAEELTAMNERGGSLLTALRGKLVVEAGGQQHLLDYARAKEIRVPRLPKVKLHELDGARYSPEEVNIVFYLGVENPNPFPLKLSGLRHSVTVAGKKLSDGTIGRGEKVAASSTGVFELPVAFTKDSYGPGAKDKIKTLSLPYQLEGELFGDLFQIPYQLSGDVKLNVSK